MSSLTMPSTPSSRRSCIWPGSFTVQTWTGRPSSWAQESNRRSARGTNLRRTGIWAQAGPLGTALLGNNPQAARRNRRTSPGPMDVHSRGPSAARARRRRSVRERADAHPVKGAGSSDRPHQGTDRTVGLRVDVDTDVGPARQHIGEYRDRVRPPDAGGTYLSPGQRPDLTGPVGHPVQPVVVEDDQDVVGGHLHVGLEVAVAQLDGPCERGHRVLPPIKRPAAVGDRQRPVVLKEPMGHDSSFLPLLHRPPRAVDPTASPGTCQAAEGVTWRSRSPGP